MHLQFSGVPHLNRQLYTISKSPCTDFEKTRNRNSMVKGYSEHVPGKIHLRNKERNCGSNNNIGYSSSLDASSTAPYRNLNMSQI